MIVYKITNITNGKMYVGQTVRSLKKRWQSHCKKSATKCYLQRAIIKYGKDSFKIEILGESSSLAELNNLEIYWINKLNTVAPNGYNLTLGGEGTLGRTYTEETKLKMSLAQKGKSPSEATLKAASKARLGKSLPKKITDKISLSLKGFKRPKRTELHKKNHAKSISGKPNKKKRKPISCSNGSVYESIAIAATILNIYPGDIINVLKGRRSDYRGYSFEYVA